MPGPSEAGYRISCSGLLISHIKSLLAKADRLDSARRKQFREALKNAFHKLGSDPLNWGEPEGTLKYSGLTIYHALSSVLSVRYTVLEEQRVVIIQTVIPVLSFPLENGADENT